MAEISGDESIVVTVASSEETSGEAPVPVSLASRICALVFVSGRPISSNSLSQILGVEVDVVEDELTCIRERLLSVDLGLEIREVANGWQLRSVEALAPTIKLMAPPKLRRLSKAVAETLAVVAYQQPVGKAEIDRIRGVDSVPTLRTLIDLKLVRGVGRADSPGQPLLYGTTTNFLEKFGLKDLAQLPSIRELKDFTDIEVGVEDDSPVSETAEASV